MPRTPALRHHLRTQYVGGVVLILALCGTALACARMTWSTVVLELAGFGLLAYVIALVLWVLAVRALRFALRPDDKIALAEEHGQQLETVLALSQRLWLEQNQEDLLRAAAETARNLIAATSAIAYLHDEHSTFLSQAVHVPVQVIMQGPMTIPVPPLGSGIVVEGVGARRRVLVPIESEYTGVVGLLRLGGVLENLDEYARKSLTILANQTALALQNARLRHRALAQASEDGLTNLLNHRTFHARLDEEIARAHRSQRPLAMMMVDLDNFGSINNTYGHQVGDSALVTVAAALRGSLRTSDVVARYGGDEFAVILTDTGREEVVISGQRVCLAIAACTVVGGGATIGLSASVGVAVLGLHAQERQDLIRAADQAAYAAKRSGKGRVCWPEDVATTFDRNPTVLAAQLENANMATVEALAVAVDAKDSYTRGHSQRVSTYAETLARAMALPEAQIARVRVAGLLHDVGKIGVPDAILTKLGPLTDEEFAVLEEHAIVGERMVAAVPYLREIAPAVRHHHERWDGHGYPDGLSGQAIPQESAIIMVADSFDAMTSSRTYRPALTLAEARRRVHEGSGTQFDPRVVAAFEQSMSDGTFKALSPGGTLPLHTDYIARASARLNNHARVMRKAVEPSSPHDEPETIAQWQH